MMEFISDKAAGELIDKIEDMPHTLGATILTGIFGAAAVGMGVMTGHLVSANMYGLSLLSGFFTAVAGTGAVGAAADAMTPAVQWARNKISGSNGASPS